MQFRTICLTAATAGLLSTPALADFTTVNPPHGNEASLAEILSSVYGGTFAQAGNDFSNGTVSAVRIDDDDDRIYGTDTYSADAKAVYAAYSQKFGYLPGSDGGSYVNLFDVTGGGTSVTGAVNDVSLTGPFRFARNGALGLVATSDPNDNLDNRDHLVTFRIEGLTTSDNVRLLAFEDKVDFDFDFNDLVVEVRSTGDDGGEVIPSPAALGGGFLLLCGLAGRRRRH